MHVSLCNDYGRRNKNIKNLYTPYYWSTRRQSFSISSPGLRAPPKPSLHLQAGPSFGKPHNDGPIGSASAKSDNKLVRYSERRVLGFTAEQMHSIVADVARYDEFVPWCVKSTITNPRDG